MTMEKKVKIGLICLLVGIALVGGWFIWGYMSSILAPDQGDTIWVYSKVGGNLTKEDIATVKRVRGVDFATEYLSKVAKIKFNDRIKYLYVTGVSYSEKIKVMEYPQTKIEGGRWLESGDEYKVVIGHDLANKSLFDRNIEIGDVLRTNDREFEVIGTLKPAGNPQDDGSLWIPLETAKTLFNESNKISGIVIHIKTGYDTSKVAVDVKSELMKVKGEMEGEEGFQVQISLK